jgi:hypothetical protein
VNAAVTDLFADIVTTHDPVPEQAPPKFEKIHPLLGTSVNVTCVPDV